MAASTAASLDDLIVLNDEILALTRAGVPLEPGLVRLSEELPHGAGELARQWGQRLAQGASLDQMLDEAASGVPGIYRALLTAGLRSGRLPAALEGMATSGRRVAELQGLVSMSLLYPLFVLILAYLFLLLGATFVVPLLASMYQSARIQPDFWFGWLQGGAEIVARLHFWPVLAIGLVAIAWSVLSARATALQPGWVDLSLGWLPGVRTLLTQSRLATFTELLALLIAERVPLPESLTLAADAIGEPSLQAAAKDVADRVTRGQLAGPPPDGLPPTLAWVLLGGGANADLPRALRYAAESYRTKARDQAQWLRLTLPLVLLLAIGGVATALYAVVSLGPWFALLYRLGADVPA